MKIAYFITAVVIVFFFITLICSGFTSQLLNGFNPESKLESCGELCAGWVYAPAKFTRSECHIQPGPRTVKHQVVHTYTCGSNPVLRAKSNLKCEHLETLGILAFPEKVCYEVRSCQTDLCKYDCKIESVNQTTFLDLLVTNMPDQGSDVWSHRFNVTVAGDRFDLPEYAMCDFIAGLNGAKPTSLHINPFGRYSSILIGVLSVYVLLSYAICIITAMSCCSDEVRAPWGPRGVPLHR